MSRSVIPVNEDGSRALNSTKADLDLYSESGGVHPTNNYTATNLTSTTTTNTEAADKQHVDISMGSTNSAANSPNTSPRSLNTPASSSTPSNDNNKSSSLARHHHNSSPTNESYTNTEADEEVARYNTSSAVVGTGVRDAERAVTDSPVLRSTSRPTTPVSNNARLNSPSGDSSQLLERIRSRNNGCSKTTTSTIHHQDNPADTASNSFGTNDDNPEYMLSYTPPIRQFSITSGGSSGGSRPNSATGGARLQSSDESPITVTNTPITSNAIHNSTIQQPVSPNKTINNNGESCAIVDNDCGNKKAVESNSVKQPEATSTSSSEEVNATNKLPVNIAYITSKEGEVTPPSKNTDETNGGSSDHPSCSAIPITSISVDSPRNSAGSNISPRDSSKRRKKQKKASAAATTGATSGGASISSSSKLPRRSMDSSSEPEDTDGEVENHSPRASPTKVKNFRKSNNATKKNEESPHMIQDDSSSNVDRYSPVEKQSNGGNGGNSLMACSSSLKTNISGGNSNNFSDNDHFHQEAPTVTSSSSKVTNGLTTNKQNENNPKMVLTSQNCDEPIVQPPSISKNSTADMSNNVHMGVGNRSNINENRDVGSGESRGSYGVNNSSVSNTRKNGGTCVLS